MKKTFYQLDNKGKTRIWKIDPHPNIIFLQFFGKVYYF
jgi:hypothetical protein